MSTGARAIVVAKHVFHVLVLAIGFVVCLVASALLNLNLPATRRFACRLTTYLLADLFEGKITLEKVDSIGLGGIRGARARITDDTGKQVILVDGLDANAPVLGIVRSAALGSGDIEIDIPRAYVDSADANLDFDGPDMRLARAFLPKPTPKKSTGPGRGVRLDIREIAIAHAWGHGSLPNMPPLDADVDNARAELVVIAHNQPDDSVHLNVGRVHVKSRAAPYDVNVDGDAHLVLSVPLVGAPDLTLGGGYHGLIAGIPTKAKATMDGDHLDATVDISNVEEDKVQRILPGTPLAAVADAHAEAHGTLKNLDASAKAKIGPGTVSARANILVGSDVRIAGSFDASHVDARSFQKTAPATDVNASGKTTIVLANGAVDGTYSLDVAKGSVQEIATPAAHAEGKYSLSGATAMVRVDEPGATTYANAKLDLTKQLVTFDTSTKQAVLGEIPQLKGAARGTAEVSTHGTISIPKQTIDAAYEVTGKDIAASGYVMHHVEASGTVIGPIARPEIVVSAHGRDVQNGNKRIERVTASAKIGFTASVDIHDVNIDMSTSGEHVKVHGDRVVIESSGVKVDGGTVDGLGALVGVNAETRPGLIALSVHAQHADLAKIGRIVGLHDVTGHVSINADVRLTSTEAQGKIDANIRNATIGPLRGATAHLDATLMGKSLIANAHFDSPSFGRLDINTSTVHLTGSPLSPKAWVEATGDAQIDGEVSLKRIQEYVPQGTLTDLDGMLLVEGEVKRDDPHAAPSIDLDASTRNLVVAKAPEWRVQGIDLDVDAQLDPQGHATLDSKAHDDKGNLVTLQGTADLPLAELASLRAPVETLERSPATFDLEIPQRKLKDMPKALALGKDQGKIEVSFKGQGTYLDPNVSLTVRATNLRSPDLPLSLATSGVVGLTYDGKVAGLTGNIVAKKKSVLDFDAQANVLWADVLRMGPSPNLPWNGSGHVVLNELPLQTLQPLADRSVKGNVSGEVSVVDLHKDAHASVQLSFDALKVGKARYTNMYVRGAMTTDGAMTALVRLDQKDGHAEATLAGGETWGAALVPKVDPSKPVVASLDAKNISAGVAQPFLDDYLNELDGRVDAQAKAIIPPSGAPQVQGNIALRQGLVQSPILGEEFHDVTANVVLAPNGADTLATANEIVAYGTTGKITAKATARMHGVQFAGANLVAILGAKSAPLQLTAEGQDYGEGYGSTTVSITKPQPTQTDVKVVIPSFHVMVPQVSTRNLQDLGPAENIRVGVKDASGAFMPLALGAKEEPVTPSNSRLDVDIQMGKDCDVRVGDTVRVQLEGGPHLTVMNGTVVTGQIRLRGGTLDVQGKQFDIQDGGTITFNGGDPGNPDIVIRAEWDAPDGTHVFADFNGPLKTGKVALRSEPPKSENELLALILFGSSDEAGGANSSETSGLQAATTAGGFATQGVNKAINDLTGVDATVRVDTSEQNNPKPEVQVQLTKTIALELETVLGQIPFGDNPDTNYVTVDWRFRPRWSLATTFGDKGTSILDVLWQYRY